LLALTYLTQVFLSSTFMAWSLSFSCLLALGTFWDCLSCKLVSFASFLTKPSQIPKSLPTLLWLKFSCCWNPPSPRFLGYRNLSLWLNDACSRSLASSSSFSSTISSKCGVAHLSGLLTLEPRRNDSSRKLAIAVSCLSFLSYTSPNITFILSNCCCIAGNMNESFSLVGDDLSLEDIVEIWNLMLVVTKYILTHSLIFLHLIRCNSLMFHLNSGFS